MISSKFVSICNRSHDRRVNSEYNDFCRAYPYLMPSFEGNPLTQGHDVLSQETRVFVAANGENFVILVCAVLT